MNGKTLVAYFSAEGATEAVAKILAKELGADLFEIKPVAPYTSADLDWRNEKSRSSTEMNDESCRPTMAEDTDISAYDDILVGFPVWWYVEPRIIDTFLESQSFAGKNIIPFATSGGSGIERASARLKKICPEANWKAGRLLSKSSAAAWAKTL